MILAPAYLPNELKEIWLAAYIDAGGTEGGSGALSYALEVMRGLRTPPNTVRMSQSAIASLYDRFFGGNRRDDGTFRFDELGYTEERLAFADVIGNYGIRPDVWESRFEELIAGDVSVGEFDQRIALGYELIYERAPEVAAFYAREYGSINMQPEDILVAFLDPDVGTEILQRNASVSLIGGTAEQFGFNIAADFAQRLLIQGVEGIEGSQDLFGAAREQLPILEALAKRHNDPDDDFDLYEFASAYVFNDPQQRRRMARLIAQERALFTGGKVGVARDRSGGLTGLLSQ